MKNWLKMNAGWVFLIACLTFFALTVYSVGKQLTTTPVVCNCHGICDTQFKCGLKECPK